jgi:hypothetical protein
MLEPKVDSNDHESKMKMKLLVKWGLRALILTIGIMPNVAFAGDAEEVENYMIELDSGYSNEGTALIAYTQERILTDHSHHKFDGFNTRNGNVTCVKDQLFDVAGYHILFETFRSGISSTEPHALARKMIIAEVEKDHAPPDSSISR